MGHSMQVVNTRRAQLEAHGLWPWAEQGTDAGARRWVVCAAAIVCW